MKRRDSLKLINGLLLGLGLSSFRKSPIADIISPEQESMLEFAKRQGIKYVEDSAGLSKYSKDFGNFYESVPQIALLPESIAQLQAIVTFANRTKTPILARGAGHSQSGQSLTSKNGVTIDLRSINKIHGIQHANDGSVTVDCSPGTTLKQINEYTLAVGYMLPVMPFYHELTIGGVLSAGGIGSGAHKYGLLISNVVELEVLQADGSIVICTPQLNSDTFHAVLGTCGHFGIIIRAKIKLISASQNFRTMRLVYEDIDQWLTDYGLLIEKDISNLQGICIRSKENPFLWNFILEVSLQAESIEGLAKYDEILSKLKNKNQLPKSDYTPTAFLSRYESRFEQMRLNKRFEQTHPILEFILDARKAKEMIQQTLLTLPPAYEDGYRLIYINKSNLPPYFMVPEADRICMVAILPTGIDASKVEECKKAADDLHRYAKSISAKRYLSGWLGMMNADEFKNHYAGKLPELTRLKKKMDPNNIFRSAFSDRFLSILT